MKKNNIIIVAIILVAIAGVGAYAINKNNSATKDSMMTNSNPQSAVQADTSSADYKQYAALKTLLTH